MMAEGVVAGNYVSGCGKLWLTIIAGGLNGNYEAELWLTIIGQMVECDWNLQWELWLVIIGAPVLTSIGAPATRHLWRHL